ncbi:MAG: hypothetical protein OSJ43_02140 [Oscillospiraceae bacterium]|nr:hypothetical protein [Oscillospiraceae bacterium]
MKKLISIITVFAACVTLTACSTADESSTASDKYEGLELVRWHSDRVEYEDLAQLEKDSHMIVIGEFIGDDNQDTDYQYNAGFQKDLIINIRSTNTIRVSKVFKGDIEEGDCVDVHQRYGIADSRLISFSDLTPMQKGDEWLFFLRNSTDLNGYWCASDTFGRYPVPSVENEPMPLSDSPDLGVYSEQNFQRDIYNEILEKYDI